MKRDELLLLFGLASLLAIMMFFTSGTYSANFITQQIASNIQTETNEQTKILSKLLFRQFNNSKTTINDFDKIFKILGNESKENLGLVKTQDILLHKLDKVISKQANISQEHFVSEDRANKFSEQNLNITKQNAKNIENINKKLDQLLANK